MDLDEILMEARMRAVPKELRSLEERIDYLVNLMDERKRSVPKDPIDERMRPVQKRISSLARRIDYLLNRKDFLTTMMDKYMKKKNIKGELVQQHQGEEQPHCESSPSSTCTDPSTPPPPPPPLKKLKQKSMLAETKVTEDKRVEQEDPKIAGKLVGQEQPPDENSPDSTVTDPSLPPLPIRCPLYPHGGDREDFRDWVQEVERVRKLNAPRDSLPTHVPTQCKCRKDPETYAIVGKDKMMLLPVSDVVVSISYVCCEPRDYPGQIVNDYCSGMIISWDKVNKKARILTCDYFVGNQADTKRKLLVRWHYMEDTVFEAELLFFSEHYQIALLEIPVDVHFHIDIPPFGSYPKYGHEVFTLVREPNDLSVMVRRGKISQLQECYLSRHHLLYVDSELPDCGGGGPVVDHNGDVVGISIHHTEGTSAILSITTALSCVEMWNKFGCIARPSLGMCLKNAEFGGFIVEEVDTDSNAWKLGIRKGNGIVSFDMKCPIHLPEFEDFLLSCGLAHLHSMHLEANLKLQVHDLGKDVKRNINLRVPFSTCF